MGRILEHKGGILYFAFIHIGICILLVGDEE